MSDLHKRHELRQARHLRVVPTHSTVPAELEDTGVPPVPNWMRPVPRVRRHSSPLITYQRQRHALRAWCDRLPLLVPLARAVF